MAAMLPSRIASAALACITYRISASKSMRTKMRRTEIWNACDEIADVAKELDELLRNEGGDD